MSDIEVNGLPCVRFKRVKHQGDFIVEEHDYYVQDHSVENAILILQQLMTLNDEGGQDE